MVSVSAATLCLERCPDGMEKESEGREGEGERERGERGRGTALGEEKSVSAEKKRKTKKCGTVLV